MDYELSKRLIKIAADEKKVNRRFNLAAFIVMRPQISKAINDGWSMKFIWETLSQDKKIGCSYRTFLQMCKKHVGRSHDTNKESDKREELIPESSSEADSATVDKAVEEKPESSGDRIKVSDVKADAKEDYGNPKGFEWDTDFDPKDFV